MQQSPARRYTAESGDASAPETTPTGAGLAIVLASLILVILIFAATHG